MVSSDFLFHFTKNLSNLTSIIDQGIWVKRCNEDVSFLKILDIIDVEAVFGKWINHQEKNSKDEQSYELSIPMACFCDLPLALAKDHRKVYGNYALGLDKNWGTKIGINPVCYLSPKSDLSSAIQKINILTQRISTDHPDQQLKNAFYKLLSFIKLYEGPYEKGDYSTPKHRFYNEREWRYLLKGDFVKIAPPNQFSDEEKNKKLDTLKFSSNDVKCIVVNKINEEAEIIHFLKQSKLDHKDIEIVSFEEIET